MIKVSDYIFRQLADYEVRQGCRRGSDAPHKGSLGREKRLKFICNHHGQVHYGRLKQFSVYGKRDC